MITWRAHGRGWAWGARAEAGWAGLREGGRVRVVRCGVVGRADRGGGRACKKAVAGTRACVDLDCLCWCAK